MSGRPSWANTQLTLVGGSQRGDSLATTGFPPGITRSPPWDIATTTFSAPNVPSNGSGRQAIRASPVPSWIDHGSRLKNAASAVDDARAQEVVGERRRAADRERERDLVQDVGDLLHLLALDRGGQDGVGAPGEQLDAVAGQRELGAGHRVERELVDDRAPARGGAARPR